MANTCSVLNKIDELAELIDEDQADIALPSSLNPG